MWLGKLARLVGAGMVVSASAAFAERPQILIPHGPPAHAAAHGFRSLGHPVRVNKGPLQGLAFGQEAELQLPNGTRHEYVFELVKAHGDGVTSVVGHHKQRGNDHRAIITTGPAGSFGVLSTPDGEFRIVPGDDGHDWLVDMTAEQEFIPITLLGDDVRYSPPDLQPKADQRSEPMLAIPGVNTVSFPKAMPAQIFGVDLMFVVTRGLANRLGASLMTRLHFLVTRANTSYVDSEVGIVLRMVGVTIVDYPDTGGNDTALYQITPSCTASPFSGCNSTAFDAATFGGVDPLRTATGADLVAFLRNGNSFGGSGIAWLGGFGGGSITNPNRMYSVTTGCVLGCEAVFIHEVGHNMGNHHDRATVAWQDQGLPDNVLEGSAYGHYSCTSGFLSCNPNLAPSSGGCPSNQQPECQAPTPSPNTNFSEIMAYFQGTTVKNYKFSNPNVTCVGNAGSPLPCGVANVADTAASMNARAAALSAIRNAAQTPPPAPAGSLQFTATTFFATETAGSVNVTVSRLGGSSGAVQAQVTTSSGTATAVTDYTTVNATVTWGDGDAANKTVTIPIINDGVTEGSESFTVTLANASGAVPGVFIGQPSTATVVINEPWPPGGVAPAGFTTASGAAWATATDFSNDGDGVSFKSGAIVFPGGGVVPAPSTTSYTATFAAGTVAFAYKVDSYPGNGFFEFLIDGVVVHSNSGDSGWLTFSTTITAGSHTLQWRYRTMLSFFCGSPGVSPPPPQGTACADRAWIDAVSLPLPTTPTTNARLSGISTRGPVLTGDNITIGGFIIGGSAPKRVIVYARGPSLAAQGVPGVLSDPTLTLVQGATVIATNDNWQLATNAAEITALNLQPPSALESAILMTLNPGAYTALVSGLNGLTGVGIVEVYEVDGPAVPLVGISTRGLVQTGNNVMIAGFIISGTTPQRVVVKARGPSVGVPGSLANPTLTLVQGTTVLAVNDDWQTDPNAATLQAIGGQPSHALDSAILITLNPGAYTAILSGAGNTTGVGIIEVYQQ